jgi:hypothetical protein
MWNSGDAVRQFSSWSSGTEATVGLRLSLSLHSFAYRHRACTSSLDDGAQTEEAEEMEDERESRDESETMDSGEDAVETELARDERRVK